MSFDFGFLIFVHVIVLILALVLVLVLIIMLVLFLVLLRYYPFSFISCFQRLLRILEVPDWGSITWTLFEWLSIFFLVLVLVLVLVFVFILALVQFKIVVPWDGGVGWVVCLNLKLMIIQIFATKALVQAMFRWGFELELLNHNKWGRSQIKFRRTYIWSEKHKNKYTKFSVWKQVCFFKSYIASILPLFTNNLLSPGSSN